MEGILFQGRHVSKGALAVLLYRAKETPAVNGMFALTAGWTQAR